MTTLDEISAPHPRPITPTTGPSWTRPRSTPFGCWRRTRCTKVGNGHPGHGDEPRAAGVHAVSARRCATTPATSTGWVATGSCLSAGHSSLTAVHPALPRRVRARSCPTSSRCGPGGPRRRGIRVPSHHGVEITTGPLGQGLASAVGMAMASRYERGLFDPDAAPGTSPFDHYIYVIASDGDIEEGVTSGGLVAGRHPAARQPDRVLRPTTRSRSRTTPTSRCPRTPRPATGRYGWHVQERRGRRERRRHRGGDREQAKAVTDKPSFIAIRTVIGYPAPNLMNTGKAHGADLGDDEVAAVKKILGFDPDKTFEVRRRRARAHPRARDRARQGSPREWQPEFDAWAAAGTGSQGAAGPAAGPASCPTGWDADLPHWEPGSKPLATRAAFGQVLGRGRTEAARVVGRFRGPGRQQQHHDQGCATRSGRRRFRPRSTRRHWYGRVLHFGVREHAMGSILSGIVLHGPTRAYGGTFLTVLRLHAPGGAACLADGHRHHLRVDPRLDRARRGRSDPPADRTSRGAAGDSQPVGGAARAMRTRPRTRGGPSWRAAAS